MLDATAYGCLKALHNGPIQGAASVGAAVWPNREMASHGAALAVSKALKALADDGLITVQPGADKRSKATYTITDIGCGALDAIDESKIDRRQLALF